MTAGSLTLTKHHGLGNDFLVLLDRDGSTPVDAALARALCDRRRGVGADGVIRATAGREGADLTMELRNSDGGPAEISGNGIRCLAQAALDSGMVAGPVILIATGGGLRSLRLVSATDRAGLSRWAVDMGAAKVEETALEGGGLLIDLGNPHLVLRDTGQDLAVLGARHPDLNVELISARGDGLEMRVWERGAGETLECGTGSCAAAVAGAAWALTGDTVTVHNPGGDVVVELGETITLTGPAQHVARVEFACH